MSHATLQHADPAHAPAGVAHDPTPVGKVGIWLFLASEVMFFVGVLGTYIVLRSGAPARFAEHAAALNAPLAAVNTLVLILSSLTMALAVDAARNHNRGRLITCLAITLLCALGFMGIKTYEYTSKFHHHTVVARDAGKVYVYDGHVSPAAPADNTLHLRGHRMPMPVETGFSIHWASPRQVKAGEAAATGTSPDKLEESEFTIPRSAVIDDVSYGPWKNIFYACYFTTTGIHGLHVIGGAIPLLFLFVHALRGRIFPAHTEYVGIYWHFVDLVWIFLFPLLYLI